MNKSKPSFSQLKGILDTKFVGGLLIASLCAIVLLLFSEISYIFHPLVTFISVAGVPIIIAGVFYYILHPVVVWLESKNVKRVYGIALVFLMIIVLLTLGLFTLVPMIQIQLTNLINNFPKYFSIMIDQLNGLPQSSLLRPFHAETNEMMRSISSSLTDFIQVLSSSVVSSVESIISKVTTVIISLITFPIVLFFLLKDGEKIPNNIASLVPARWQPGIKKILREMSIQVSSYIRGQLLVAFCVAILFTIGFTIVGLEYALTLGLLAGALNLIPYLGSFLATIPALILAFMGGPLLVLKVILLFAVEQLIEGHFISPLVLSSKLKVHPITILFILLSAGKIFGLFGVILGVPVYAVLKVLVSNIFSWVKRSTDLYNGR